MKDETHDKRSMESSIEEIFRKSYPAVVSFFRWRGFSAEESRDLAQETFLRAFRGIKFVGSDEQSTTYFMTIARNVCLNRLRSKRAHKRSPTPEALEDVDDPLLFALSHSTDETQRTPEDELLHRERLKLVQEAVEELPRRMRLSVRLRFQGLTYREIAKVLNATTGSVATLLHAARKRLKSALADRLDQTD